MKNWIGGAKVNNYSKKFYKETVITLKVEYQRIFNYKIKYFLGLFEKLHFENGQLFPYNEK